jgi:hypothetical protein
VYLKPVKLTKKACVFIHALIVQFYLVSIIIWVCNFLHVLVPGICKDSSNIDIRIKVTNTGEMKGRHSVLLFAASPSAGANGAPLKKLVRFQLVQLESGQESELIFNLNPCKDLGTVTEDGSHILEIGRHTLSIGTEGTNIHSFQVHRPQ